MKPIKKYVKSASYHIEGYIRKKFVILFEKKAFAISKVSIISNNCVGGVIYHDFDSEFLSPTINCYFNADDYIKFITNLSYYFHQDLRTTVNQDGTVIGTLDDIRVFFVHDSDSQKVYSAWNRRKNRVNINNIFIIASDRDGWTEEYMETYSQLKFPKCFFTAKKDWANYPFSIYYPEYSRFNQVPNLIPCRKIYAGHKIFKMMFCKKQAKR